MTAALSIELSLGHREAIFRHARGSTDEVCGLLLGRGNCIDQVQPCANVAAEPARRFEIDPAPLLAAHRAARGGGPAVIGHYHSHPSGDATPSPRDAADAVADGSMWIVVAGDRLTAWRAVADGALHGRFVAIDVMTPVAR